MGNFEQITRKHTSLSYKDRYKNKLSIQYQRK